MWIGIISPKLNVNAREEMLSATPITLNNIDEPTLIKIRENEFPELTAAEWKRLLAIAESIDAFEAMNAKTIQLKNSECTWVSYLSNPHTILPSDADISKNRVCITPELKSVYNVNSDQECKDGFRDPRGLSDKCEFRRRAATFAPHCLN